MPPFKDEHILIIAPGSEVTLAQLGLPESFTPARFRFPTRMFPAEKKGEFEPYRIRERRQAISVKRAGTNGNVADEEKKVEEPTVTDVDTEMKDVEHMAPKEEKVDGDSGASTVTEHSTAQGGTAEDPSGGEDSTVEPAVAGEKEADTGAKPAIDSKSTKTGSQAETETVEEIFYEEDIMTDENAIYPMRGGRIVDWPCFFALLSHVYNTLSPPFHTPILLIAEPVWSARDRESITQFVFEKFKTPAFAIMDSALAVCYGYGTATATVVDIGKDKADVTAVTDFCVNEHGRGVALEGCGGEAMTARLLELLGPKGFTREMCEQLKRSPITEILPPGTPLPGEARTSHQSGEPSAATTVNGSEPNAAARDAGNGAAKRSDTGNGVGGSDGNGEDEDEEILDVAAIVSGNTSEYLARREREKLEKAALKKSAADQVSTKPIRLPNSKREKALFQIEEFVRLKSSSDAEPAAPAPAPAGQFIRQKRDIEVGIERFLATTPSKSTGDRITNGLLDDIATQIHHTILAVPDASKRSDLWDSLIVVGNGSKVKGFTQALLGVITQKFILSPSATIFTSEIPSNFSTPLPTGGTTTPAHPSQQAPLSHPAAHGVNPLLVAATHANNPSLPNAMNPGTPSMSMSMSIDPNSPLYHRSTGHSQTPTSAKVLKPPEYFPEWKDQGNTSSAAPTGGAGHSAATKSSAPTATAAMGAGNLLAQVPSATGAAAAAATDGRHGMEEATFLGAQVAAKVIFVLDQGLSKGFMSRVEYNESGPAAIHEYVL